MLDIQNLGTMGKSAEGRVHDELYDRVRDGDTVQVAELGYPQWGYLHALTDEEKQRLGIDADRAAALCWTDGSDDNADGGVQLLAATEASLIRASFSGPIVDRILKHYEERGGADDGHPAHALWRLREARRQDVARPQSNREAHERNRPAGAANAPAAT